MKNVNYRSYAGAVLSVYLHNLLVEKQKVRQGKNIEALHRMRVSSRRLRSGLKVFSAVLPSGKAEYWNKRVRKLGRALGEARQLDIQLKFLDSVKKRLVHSKAVPSLAGIDCLSDLLEKNRRKAQKRIVDALDAIRKNGSLADLKLHLKKLSQRNDDQMPGDFVTMTKAMVTARLKELLAYERYVYQPKKAKELHRMRIAAKNLRYTLELVKPFYEKKIDLYIRAARAVQDVLGDLHELDVWLASLPDVAVRYRKHKKRTEAVVYLQKECAALRERTYGKFVGSWKLLRKRKVWESLAKMT